MAFPLMQNASDSASISNISGPSIASVLKSEKNAWRASWACLRRFKPTNNDVWAKGGTSRVNVENFNQHEVPLRVLQARCGTG